MLRKYIFGIPYCSDSTIEIPDTEKLHEDNKVVSNKNYNFKNNNLITFF